MGLRETAIQFNEMLLSSRPLNSAVKEGERKGTKERREVNEISS